MGLYLGNPTHPIRAGVAGGGGTCWLTVAACGLDQASEESNILAKVGKFGYK